VRKSENLLPLIISLLLIGTTVLIAVTPRCELGTYTTYAFGKAGITTELFPTPPHRANYLVGIYYYVWYGKNSRHWNDDVCNTVKDIPILGYYDSYDSNVIKQHINWISDAKIDFLVISWWGRNSYEDKVARKVVKIINEMGNPIRFCLIIERNRYIDFSYLGRFFNNSAYLMMNGKPVIITYQPHPNNQDYYWINYLENNDEVYHIMPGYNEAHLGRKNPLAIPRGNGEYYRERWVEALEKKPHLVLIVSFNEFHEQTNIEPCHNWESPFLYLKITEEYADKFKKIIS
jgi:uncharacterized protein YggT (Ycf19 family)